MIPDTDPGTDELAPCRIDSHQDIIVLLHSLAVRCQLLHMNFEGSAESLVTAILAVHASEGSLIVSGSSASSGAQPIAERGEITFETVPDRVRIRFSVSRAEVCQYQNRPALRMAIPASLTRLQRRESCRVPTPVATSARCTIRIAHASGGNADSVSLDLQNVSGGGVAILDEAMTLDDTIGRIYQDCQIDLPGASRIVTAVQIRNSRNLKLANGKTVRRLGCLFLDLPGPMLAAVQRYILKLEREQKARLNELE